MSGDRGAITRYTWNYSRVRLTIELNLAYVGLRARVRGEMHGLCCTFRKVPTESASTRCGDVDKHEEWGEKGRRRVYGMQCLRSRQAPNRPSLAALLSRRREFKVSNNTVTIEITGRK